MSAYLYKSDGFIDRELCERLRTEAAAVAVEPEVHVSTVWPERVCPPEGVAPFAIVRHVDYYGFTWFYPCNKLGHVCAPGMSLRDALRHVEVLQTCYVGPFLSEISA